MGTYLYWSNQCPKCTQQLHFSRCIFPVTMSTASGSHVFFFLESAYAIVLLGGNARHVRWRHDKQAYPDMYFHIAPSRTMGLSICCSCIDRRRIRSSRFRNREGHVFSATFDYLSSY